MKKHTTTYVIFLLLFWNISPIYSFNSPTKDTIKLIHQRYQFEQTMLQDEMVLEDLTPGKSYLVHIAIGNFESCLPIASMNIPFEILREDAEQLFIDFVATDTNAKIKLKTPCKENAKNNYVVNMQCTNCPYQSKSITNARNAAVIQAQSGIDEEVLIKDVFVAGGCYDVDNITYKGDDVGKGVFSKGDAINVEDGIILSTGDVSDCSGPNSATDISTKFNSQQSDADLVNLLRISGSSSRTVTDVAIIEFDFTPTSDKVSFEYVWASDEYCDYSNSSFNDVFGFFVSGPGINGPFSNNGINIATIPGTNEYVAINSINWSNNKPYYNNNAPFFQALSGGCKIGEIFASAVAKNELEYDGFTDVLTATVNVIPCATYHIKLAVGDVNDKIFDSAVFLKANSFKLGDPAELSTEIPDATFPDSSLVYESCQESFFVFKRTEDSDITKPQIVPFTISNLSTAQAGLDYSFIASPVIIPIGKDSIKIPVNIFDDGVAEGPESIIFELESACTCEGILTELTIVEPDAPIVSFDDLATCPGGTVSLSPNIEGGVGDYTLEWSTNETGAVITTEINQPTTYGVTITDECGSQAEAEITVEIEEQTAKLSGELLVCNGEGTGGIEVQFSGSAPYSLEYEFNGDTRNISNIDQSIYLLPETEAGTYQAISMSSNGCIGKGEGVGEIKVSNLILEYKYEPPKCAETVDGFIEITLDENESTYIYDWDNGSDGKKLDNLDAGTYSVKVTNELGCGVTEEFELIKPEPLSTKLTPNGFVNCYNPNAGSIDLEIVGGNPGYIFEWSNGAGSVQNPDNLVGGEYSVIVTDTKGCESTVKATINADTETPLAMVQVDGIISCANEELAITATGTSTGSEFNYQWQTEDGSISHYENQLTPVAIQAGTYVLTVLNEDNGCETTAEAFVKEDKEMPQLDIAEAFPLNCQTKSQQLSGTIIEAMSDYSMNWTTNDGNFVSDKDILNPEINGAGSYTFEVTNNINGCVASESITVSMDTISPSVSLIEPLTLTCDRIAVAINTEVDMPENKYGFNWQTTEGNFLENKNTLTPSVNKPGVYTLEVTNSENFCQTILQTNILIDTLSPKIDAGESRVFTCDLKEITLVGSIEDNRNYSIFWNTENGSILDGGNRLNTTINEPGLYQLFVKDQDNGCESADKVIITDDINRPKAVIEIPEAITCTQNMVQLDASNSTGGGNINYHWETFNGNIIDASNPTSPIMGAAGTYLLFVVDENNGCEGKGIVEIILDTIAPTAFIQAPEIFNCKTNMVEIDGSGSSTGANFLFNWTTNDGNIVSKRDVISPNVSEPGTYQVEILNISNGCTAQTSLIIIEEKPTAMNLNVEQPLCFGDKGQANVVQIEGGIGPYAYSIDGGNRFSADAGFSYLNPGFYNVVIKDVNDCELEEVIQIIQPDELAVDLGTQQEIDLGDSINLEAIMNIPLNQVADIQWHPADGLSCDDCITPSAKPFQSIDYSVEVIDQNGCIANAELRLLVDQTPHIYVPNVFRPFDSQTGNDRFTIYAKQGMVNQIINLQIYNRWGETVYQRKNFTPNDPSLGWDGFFDRQRMKPAVFVYCAEVELVDGRKVQVKGDFALVK